jgi:hypothetical protein
VSEALSSIALVTLTILAGTSSLWPMRDQLGTILLLICALPIGLLAWTFVTAAAVIGNSYGVVTIAVGLALFILVVRGVVAFTARDSRSEDVRTDRPVNVVGLGAGGAGYLLTSALLALAGVTVTTADSWKGYWPLGVMIESQGSYDSYLPSARGFLLPSISAASRFLGGEWEYVIYPLLAGVLLLGILAALYRADLRALSKGPAALIAGGVALFMLTDPSFLYHSFYVHSHLVSGAYLFLALAGLRFAFDPSTGRRTQAAPAWLVIAGASTAGLAMARPDGLAYSFIPVAVVVAVLADDRREGSDEAAFFGPLLIVLGVPLASAYLEVGVWEAAKLSGWMALAIYGLIVGAALLPRLLRAFARKLAFQLRSEHVVRTAIALGAVLVLAAAMVRWEIMSLAAQNARVNLFAVNGQYAWLWPSLAVVLAVSFLSGDAWRSGRFSTHLFATVVLFFMTAALVHGTSHPGRVGTGDSFGRVAFHIVPVIVWYAGVVAARALGDLRGHPRDG